MFFSQRSVRILLLAYPTFACVLGSPPPARSWSELNTPSGEMSAFCSALALALNVGGPSVVPPPAIGTAIERATCAEDVLCASSRIAAPGPPFAQAHLAQEVHQQKRQSLACNALTSLEKLLIGSGAAAERRRAMADPRTLQRAACAGPPSRPPLSGRTNSLSRARSRKKFPD